MGETQKKEKKKIGLTTKIFIALLAGAIFGIILCYAVPSGHIKDDIIVEGVLYVVGQGFIKLMKMLVVPLVFCPLVCGSMSIGDTKKLGTVGARTLIFDLATTALAVNINTYPTHIAGLPVAVNICCHVNRHVIRTI